jgi:hypothetical protein
VHRLRSEVVPAGLLRPHNMPRTMSLPWLTLNTSAWVESAKRTAYGRALNRAWVQR